MIKKQCNQPNCAVLIPSRQKPAYCEKHRSNLYKRQTERRDPEAKKFYESYVWKKLRSAVKVEHLQMCTECMKKGEYKTGNVVHHIKPIDTPEGWEKRLDMDNLTLLCHSCHNKIHIEKGGHH